MLVCGFLVVVIVVALYLGGGFTRLKTIDWVAFGSILIALFITFAGFASLNGPKQHELKSAGLTGALTIYLSVAIALALIFKWFFRSSVIRLVSLEIAAAAAVGIICALIVHYSKRMRREDDKMQTSSAALIQAVSLLKIMKDDPANAAYVKELRSLYEKIRISNPVYFERDEELLAKVCELRDATSAAAESQPDTLHQIADISRLLAERDTTVNVPRLGNA